MKHIVTKDDLKTFLKENPILIEYTRDVRGYKNGVVVAIDKDRIGFSKVHPEDHVIKANALDIPALQRLERVIAYMDDVKVKKDAIKALKSISNPINLVFLVPKFDRFIALKSAINMAISGKTDARVPYSMDKRLESVVSRAKAYFK